jgi:phosphoglycolate phosphatase
VIPRFPVYLFDIDGTLLDSAPDICGAVQEVLNTIPSCKPSSYELLRSYIGKHLFELFADLIPDCQPADMERLLLEYRGIYRGRGHKLTRMYPGVAETLGVLPGRKATATTKGTDTTRLVLELFGLLPHFEHVQGTDGFPSKPAPDVIFASINALGVRPEDCLMVGDSAADMEAGRRAGVRTCAVRYGYCEAAVLELHNPDYWVSDLRELLG